MDLSTAEHCCQLGELGELTEIRSIFDRERHTNEFSGSIREVSGPVVRHINRYNTESLIASTDLDDQDTSEIVANEIAYFTSIGHDFEWKTTPTIFHLTWCPD